jgi:hypothetical protein
MDRNTSGKQDFFKGPVKADTVNEKLAISCLKYLFYCSDPERTTSRVRLQDYACQSWFKHAFNAQTASSSLHSATKNLSSFILDLLTDWDQLQKWLQFFNPDGPNAVEEQQEPDAAPLYFASLLGLTQVVKQLLESDVDVNIKGWACGTALQAASARGHHDIVKLLVTHGAKAYFSENSEPFNAEMRRINDITPDTNVQSKKTQVLWP